MKDKLVIIAGPTASGKSGAGIALAKRFCGSIISADSMQVYKGMDIGSAKVTAEEMDGVPHYLIDVLEPTKEWNVVRFQEEARKAVREITDAGRLPFLVGGTGFYIQSLLYDIDFTQMEDSPEYRRELEARQRQVPGSLYRELAAVDPEEARQVHPGNVKRIIRALEFYHQSGEKISQHNAEEHVKPAAYDAVFFVLTMEREKLYRRIDARVDRMLDQGLVDEVKRLRERGLTEHDVSMQGLGYRQILQALDGKCTLEDAVTRIKTETRHFAKRQLTWFRREEAMGRSKIIWMDRDAYADEDAMLDDMESVIRGRFGMT